MEASALYKRLDSDFIKGGISDLNWAARMPGLDGYLTPAFRQSGMGLMCDFATEIRRVFTTVFLSDSVLARVLENDCTDAMIFSHHPTNWGIRHHGGNYAATQSYIARLKERNISVYVLHHPLDSYGEYSTCKTLADRLGLANQKPGFLYCGALCGVVGTADCDDIGGLGRRFSDVVGHETSLYRYGREDIRGEQIAVCPGGGNSDFVVEEMLANGVKTLITGVTLVNDHSQRVHLLEKKHGINVLGGTHYSTEKFAPMAMCGYFGGLGLEAGFVCDAPDMYDL